MRKHLHEIYCDHAAGWYGKSLWGPEFQQRVGLLDGGPW